MKSQSARLLAHLQSGQTITPLDAWRDLGIYRLSARIWDLKRDGYPIAQELVAVGNRWGESFRVARYRLNGREQGELGL